LTPQQSVRFFASGFSVAKINIKNNCKVTVKTEVQSGKRGWISILSTARLYFFLFFLCSEHWI